MTTKEDIKRVFLTYKEPAYDAEYEAMMATEDAAYTKFNKEESKPFYWIAPF